MKDRITMNKDTINLIKDGTSTFLNIAQMTQYRMKYVQNADRENKEKMIKYILYIEGIAYLLTMGIAGLIESVNNFEDEHCFI